jgi:putative hydrolase of the HAD superfamily
MWIVSDYAGVISSPPPQEAMDVLPDSAGVDPSRFWRVYWQERDSYDRGAVDAAEYWSTVCRRLGRVAEEKLVERLTALDLRLATYLNQDTLAALRSAADRRVPLALLSNAPHEWARLIDRQPWASIFRHRFFSADLRLAKPDPMIFQQLCQQLQAEPGELLFIDDRQENVDAAAKMGINAVLFTDATRLSSDLRQNLPSI